MVSIKEAIIINEEKEEVVVVIDEMEETICEPDDSISLLTQKDPISSSDSESEEEEDIPTTVEQATPGERVGVESKEEEEDIPTTVEQATPGERVGIESPASPEPRPSPASTSSASKRRRLEEEDNYRVITRRKLNDELFTLEKRLARTRAAYESARKSKLRHLLMDLQDLVPEMSKYLLVLSLTNNLLVSFSFHRGRT